MNARKIIAVCALIVFAGSLSRAQEPAAPVKTLTTTTNAAAPPPFEEPPTVPASDLLPAEILTGKDYTIDSDVPTDGFVATFRLHSKFGDYECIGREMLYTRIAELGALEQIDKVNKSEVFIKAFGKAAVEPAAAAVKIVTKPVQSAEAVPRGAGHLFKDIGEGFVDTGKSIGKLASPKNTPKPPPSREDPVGYNRFRNEWAVKLGVDPYTTNRPLAVKMNHLATIGFTTDKATSAGFGFATAGLGPIVSNIGWLSDIDEHLLTAPPADVTAANAKRLKALGVSKADMKPLLENAWFSPSLQTRFVNDLTHLQGMRGLGNETRLAAHVQSEEQARFLCGSLELLNRYNADTSALHDLSAHGDIPCATNQEGALVAAAPVDVMSWTKVAADFATPPPAGQPPAVFCTNGLLTQSAADGFKAQGWQVLEYPRK